MDIRDLETRERLVRAARHMMRDRIDIRVSASPYNRDDIIDGVHANGAGVRAMVLVNEDDIAQMEFDLSPGEEK